MFIGLLIAGYLLGAFAVGYCLGAIGYHMLHEYKEFQSIQDEFDDDELPQLYIFNQGWKESGIVLGRPLSTVFIDDNIKENLNSSINDFLNNKNWYRDSYIPYKMGILLCGGLGDGKTSLISALAYENDLDIYYVSVNSGDILGQINKIPKDRMNIVVFENLDLELSQLGDRYPFVYPRLLNVMDGLLSPSQIFVVTATSLDSIPAEFKRPGRFTHSIRINPPTKDLVSRYFQSFYDDATPEDGAQFALSVADGSSMCVIQNHLLKYRKDPAEAIKNAKHINL